MTAVDAPTLWDVPVDPLPARTSDPATSRAAARGVNHKERKREVLAAMRAMSRPAPASEIQRVMRSQGVIREIGAVRSRLAQLRRDGRTRTTGGVRTTAVDDGGTGRAEQLWILTEATS